MVAQVRNRVEFDSKLVEAGDKLVVVDFYATWCGPCKMIAPSLEKFDQENPLLTVIKVDVDEAEELAAEFDITAMPTFLFFKNGQQVEKLTGANLPKLQELIAKYAPA